MNIQSLINSANKLKDFAALEIYKKILFTAKQYNLSINDSITLLLSNETLPYNKKILMICRSIYPASKTFSVNNFSKNNINSNINISKPKVLPKEKLGCNINEIKKKSKPKQKNKPTVVETDVGTLKIG